jgi:hypothetical protein
MAAKAPALDRAEYIEQAYLFQLLGERIAEQIPMQELLEQLQHELLATTKLPMAIDFLLTELKHSGLMAPAMRRLAHYFTPLQTYLIEEAEKETGRFPTETALEILRADANYRAEGAPKAGFFLFHLEALSRNRLNYDRGLTAISNDPLYDEAWAKWILMIRAQIGLVDLSDLVFLASHEYERRLREAGEPTEGKGPFLFGEREGRIALANRRKEPQYLFSAMQRHLSYPKVPRPKPPDPNRELIPQLLRRMERLESRIKLMEQEQKASLDITKFYERPDTDR